MDNVMKLAGAKRSIGRTTGVLVATVFAASIAATSAHAESTLSIYSGYNFSPHSNVAYDFNDGLGRRNFAPGWNGLSFELPPYFGIRATHWFDSYPQFGAALDFTHAKVRAKYRRPFFETLEFTDGINYLTLNGVYRYQNSTMFTPYVGAGIGISVPHVEVTPPSGAPETLEYQFGGIAVQAFVGVDAKINDWSSLYAEFKSTFSKNDLDLTGGGYLRTDILSNQVIVGVTFNLSEVMKKF